MESILNTSSLSPIVFTSRAMAEIKRLMGEEDFDKSQFLRIGVKGGGCSGMSYMLGFDDREADDQTYEVDGLPYIMKKAHEMYLMGLTLNWQDGLNARGFTFTNPNASKTCGCGSSFAV